MSPHRAAFMVHKMVVDGYTIKLEIWDTAGQDRYVCLFSEGGLFLFVKQFPLSFIFSCRCCITIPLRPGEGVRRLCPQKTLAPMYYHGAAAAVIVYDITKASSFDMMKNWVSELQERVTEGIIISIAGNKCDLAEGRQVPTSQATDYINAIVQDGADAPIFRECSAKTGEGIQELFNDVCRQLIRKAQAEKGSA